MSDIEQQADQRRTVAPPHQKHAGRKHGGGILSSHAAAYVLSLFDKFNNDWTMNLAAMVAFNVFTSVVPLILGAVVVLAMLPVLSHDVQGFAAQIRSILPYNLRREANIEQWLSAIQHDSLPLSLLSIGGVLWGGTILFGGIENAFAIIYRVKTRDILPQKLMSLIMLLFFVLLLPISFASSVVLSIATTTLGRIIPSGVSGPFTFVCGSIAAFVALLVLFLAIYIIVPNMPVAWRYAWRGAAFAAVVMWALNTTFPFYAAHFIGTKEYSSAALVTVIVSITWVWLFSVILLLGAQINAISMRIGPWRYDISRVLMNHREDQKELPDILHKPGHRYHAPLLFSGILRDSQRVLPHPRSHKAHAAERPDREQTPKSGGR